MGAILRAVAFWVFEQLAITGVSSMLNKALAWIKSVVVAGLKRSLLAVVNKEVDDLQQKFNTDLDAFQDKLKKAVIEQGPGIIDKHFDEYQKKANETFDQLQARLLGGA